MSKLGGYQILDLKGESYTSGTAKTKDASYFNAIKNSRGKAILVSGLKVGSDPVIADTYCTFALSSSTYTGVITLGGYTYTIEVQATSVEITKTEIS